MPAAALAPKASSRWRIASAESGGERAFVEERADGEAAPEAAIPATSPHHPATIFS